MRQLENLVCREGAFLHPALRVVARGGNLWMEAEVQDNEPLVKLPSSCLIPIDDIEFRIEGASIEVVSYSPGISAERKDLLDCMLAIYNQGNKLELHAGYSPWVAFSSSRELLDQLHLARKDAPKISRFHEMARRGDLQQLLPEHFIGSRVLRFLVDPNDPKGPANRVLMPFIDFFNHHSASPGFSRDGSVLLVDASRSVQGSNECFVSYSQLDAMDSYLNYGFVDSSAPFMRSVPAVISLPGTGSIVIEGRGGAKRVNPPPPVLSDLKQLVPPFRKGGNGEFFLGSLVIPGAGNILAMHRILAFVLQRFLAPGLSQERVAGLVDMAVEQVLEANEGYYQSLRDAHDQCVEWLAETPAREQLTQLVDLQQKKLREFRNALPLIQQQGRTPSDSQDWLLRFPVF